MAPKSEFEFNQNFLENLQYKTPFFVFSKERIKNKFKEFRDCFPDASINYAMKANSEPEILQTLLDLGSEFECASVYELNILRQLKVQPKKIMYSTSVKPSSHIHEFFTFGVDRFAFDSLSELEKIASIAPGSRVYIRASVNDTGSVFRFSEKFGIEKENIVPMLQRANELGLKPYGISFHVGSQASNPFAWAEAITSLAEIFSHLKKIGIEVEILNIGGGYPCTYASSEYDLSLNEIAKNTMEAYQKLPTKPKLILEPGRGMVAQAGICVATIIGRVERRGNTWLFLDAGVYNSVFEAMAYQGSTRYRVTSLRPSYDSGETMYALAGPTGDSPDIITHEVLLPSDLGVGDKLIIHDVGAYSIVVSSRFNGFPRPDVYII